MASWVGALRLQAIISGIVCASAVALAAPGEAGRGAGAGDAERSSRQAPRGDVTRGIAFVLAPEWGAVYRHALRRMRDDIGKALTAADIRYDNLRITGGAVRFDVAQAADIEPAKASVEAAAAAWDVSASTAMPGVEIRAGSDGRFSVHLTGFGLASLSQAFIAASMTELRRRMARGSFDGVLLSDEGGRIRVEILPMAAPARAGRQC